MRKLMLLLFMIGSISFCLGESSSALMDNEASNIKSALLRLFCFEAFWELSDHRLGATLPIKIKIEDKAFRVCIDDLVDSQSAHMAGYFGGRLRSKDAVITQNEAYNINLTPPVPGYVKNKNLFEDKDVIQDILIVPTDCTPRYDPSTPQKELMLQTVISTVQKQLSSWVRQGIVKYPKKLTLIIADFNIDYPSTYILVEQINKVYSVTLHNPQNYDSDEYEKSGEYPFGEVYYKSKSLLEKIRKHGIVRKITLSP